MTEKPENAADLRRQPPEESLADTRPDAEATSDETQDHSPSAAASAGSSADTAGPAPPPQEAPLPRQLGEYRLVAKLGEGGMGTVYRAQHRRLRREVALKTLSLQRTQTASALARFQREMEAAGLLSHENIVVAHDAGEQDGTHYLAMELVDGLHLGQLLERLGPLPAADACEAIRQAARGLDHAHRQRLVHRDIKPSNLMVAVDGQGRAVVKMLDLGLARLDARHLEGDELTGEGQVMGTVDFMAPEQMDGRDVGPWSDVYSLGATLYKLLTGVAPYARAGRTLLEKLAAMSRGAAPSIRGLRGDLPAELADLVDSMISPDPQERPRSAADVERSLASFAAAADLAARLSEARRGGGDSPEQPTMRVPAAAPSPSPSGRQPHVAESSRGKQWAVWATLAALLLLAAVMTYRSWGPRGLQETGGDDPLVVARADAEGADGEAGPADAVDPDAKVADGVRKAGEGDGDGLGGLGGDPPRGPDGLPAADPGFSFGAASRDTSRDIPAAGQNPRAMRMTPAEAQIEADPAVAARWILQQGGKLRLAGAGRWSDNELSLQTLLSRPPGSPPPAVEAVSLRGLPAAACRQLGQLAPLAQQLRQLDLQDAELASDHLPPLAQLDALAELDLRGTPVDDRAVPALAAIKSLRTLDVRGAKLTPAGLRRLGELLPETAIQPAP